MIQPLKTRPPADDIDSLVDDVLSDPSRADELKRVLRTRLRIIETVTDDAADEPDLWENVPV